MVVTDQILYVVLALALYVWLFSSREDENIVLKNIIRKVLIFLYSIGFMIYSSDTKGLGPKKNPDPDNIKNDPKLETKTIIFIRHGESDWNDVFNKGINIGLLFRLARALYEEFLLLFKLDSRFIDSPLNHDGINQALELRRFIESKEHPEASAATLAHLNTLRGDEGTSSVLVASPLRRAVATTTIAMWPRMARRQEKLAILNCLQEISRNIDTQSLSSPKEMADLPNARLVPHCQGNKGMTLETAFDTTENFGNKTRSFYGIKRLRAFGEWAFKREESTVIVGGHSLWFKHFFQTFMPHNSQHDCKDKKITNSGVVAFQLYRAEGPDGTALYRIDPDSIKILYGGFTTK